MLALTSPRGDATESTLTHRSASTPPRRRHCDRCSSSRAATSAGPLTAVHRGAKGCRSGTPAG